MTRSPPTVKLPDKYYEGFNISKEIIPNDIGKFRSLLEGKNCGIFNDLKVIKRIGSDSVHATVWEIMLRSLNIKFAMKVQKDTQKSEHEVIINKILEEWPNYFLIMYSNIYCDNISFPGIRGPISGTFMFMEMAIGDLSQLLKLTHVSEIDLISHINDVLNSLEIMGLLQFYHGDLHLGNIFLVVREGSQKMVIGDFGETQMPKDEPLITGYLTDFSKLLGSLLSVLNPQDYSYSFINNLRLVLKGCNKLIAVTENRYDNWIREHTTVIETEEGEVSITDWADVDPFLEIMVKENIQYLREAILEQA